MTSAPWCTNHNAGHLQWVAPKVWAAVSCPGTMGEAPAHSLLYIFSRLAPTSSLSGFSQTPEIYILTFLHLPPGTSQWSSEQARLPFPGLDDCLLETEQLLAHLAKPGAANCSTNGLHWGSETHSHCTASESETLPNAKCSSCCRVGESGAQQRSGCMFVSAPIKSSWRLGAQ